jgi:hypothetical protein
MRDAWDVDDDEDIEVVPSPDEGGSSLPWWSLPLGPALLRWLCTPTTGEGGVKTFNTLTLWHDGWCWRMSLHERGAKLVSYLRMTSPDRLLREADYLLATETVTWRPDGSAKD